MFMIYLQVCNDYGRYPHTMEDYPKFDYTKFC